MLLITHALVGALINKLINASFIDSLLIIIGSLLPDADLFLKIKHRGFTHSLIFALPLMLVTPLGLGVLSHLILDLLTPSGVRLLFPKRDYFILLGAPLITGRSDSLICIIFLVVIMLC